MRVEERPETGLGGRVRLRPTGEDDLGFVLREEGDEVVGERGSGRFVGRSLNLPGIGPVAV